MGDDITDGELHELIAAAKADKRPGRGDFERAAISYDFKRPQQIQADQTRRLESVHEQFARFAASTLSSSMRMVVDVELAFCDQLLYNEFVLSLPSPCSAYSLTIEPYGGRAVMSLEPALLSAFVDRAFGGQGRGLQDDSRPLTQIELNVVGKVVSGIVSDLEATWENVTPIRVADLSYETNPEFIQVATPGDGAFVVALEANSKTATGLIHLCYPLSTLDPLLAKLAPSAPGRVQGSADAGVPPQVQRQSLRAVKIPVRVQAARGSLPLDEVAGIQVGDVVKMDTRVGDPAVVFVGDRPKYLGRIGLSGRKRAVEVLEPIDEEEEHLHS